MAARTRSEASDETVRQSNANLIFVKLRKMIASDTQPTDNILGAIAVAAHSLTGATGAAVAMPRDGVVVCVGRSGETAPELGARLNVDSGISGECLRTGVIMRCDDASRDFHVDAEVCRQLGLQSIAVVPLRGQIGRVGVLEAFSTETYAFTEDKMDVLGRLAGLAEAAWARGAVRGIGAEDSLDDETSSSEDAAAAMSMLAVGVDEAPVVETSVAGATSAETDVVETAVGLPVFEASVDPAVPIAAAVPLTQMREMFATVPPPAPAISGKWRYAVIAAVALLTVAVLGVYGWRAWYRSSIASRDSQPATASTASSMDNKNAEVRSEVASTADIVRPASRASAQTPTKTARTVGQPSETSSGTSDDVVRHEVAPHDANGQTKNRRQQPSGKSPAGGAAQSDPAPNGEDVPQLTAASAERNDVGSVVAPTAVLPQLSVPVSQGTAGGALLNKVQPIYPPDAKRMHVEGKVVLEATVTAQGQVDNVTLISGDSMLARAAIDAVLKWRYAPYSLNGVPISRQARITVSFIAP